MKVFFKLLVFLFFACGIEIATAQSFEVSGNVLDAESGEPIPFANIAIKDMYKGTASNVLGEFAFKVDSLPIVLVVTHLSYEPKEIHVSDSKQLTISLMPGKLVMDELVISGAGNNEYAYNLVDRAYYKIAGKINNTKYGKAFYRQVSKNGDEYSELYEIFYDTKYTNNGVDDWAIQEGRYALKLSTVDSFIYNKNFTLMVRLLTIIQPETDDLVMPVSKDVREEYTLTTERIMSVNNRKVAQIKFLQKESVTIPAMEGDIFIDTDSYEVLKVIGTIADDNLNFISLKGKSGSWKNYKVSCEIAFKQLDDEELALDYMRLGQNFDYYVDDVFVNKVETRSFLTYYEYYTPPNRKKLGGRLLRFNQRDSELLDNLGYNQLFWDENIIVKRTPVEAEVIASFEEERAFGSIYLNNRNQIVLEDYKIDNDPFIVNVRQILKTHELPLKGEKVYMHHDKPYYMAGEKMWFKSYAVSMATNLSLNRNCVLHVELLKPNGELVTKKLFYMDQGMGNGQFTIPKELDGGVYHLQAYTDVMKMHERNPFFHKELIVLSQSDEDGMIEKSLRDTINSMIYSPEGGTLIEGLPVQMGFVAKDKFGDPFELKGRIIDQDGRNINNLKSEFDGVGSLFILPKTDKEYNTSIMSHETRTPDFPVIKNEGYSVMINNLKANTIDISVRGTMKLEGKKFYILVISNGILYDRRIGLLTRGIYKTDIPKSNIPSGIAQILLVDEFGKLQIKRLVFLNQPEGGFAKYYIAKKDFRQRDRIDLVLELNNENGKPLKNANVSISVLDKDRIVRDPDKQNIKTYLDLEYLLDNKLNNPAILFRDFERETMKNVDFVMVNQQRILPDITSFDEPKDQENEQRIGENGFDLKGTARLVNNNTPLSNGFLTIVARQGQKEQSWYIRTNENGIFELNNLQIPDSTHVYLHANTQQGLPVAVELRFEKPTSTTSWNTDLYELPKNILQYTSQAEEINIEINQQKSTSFPKQSISALDDERTARNKIDNSVLLDDKYKKYENMYEVFVSRFPGVNESKQSGKSSLSLRGESGEPLIILDGFILFDPMSESPGGSKDYFSIDSKGMVEILKEIDTDKIEYVEIIKENHELGELAAKGINGTVKLFSKSGESVYFDSKLTTESMLSGIVIPEVFVSPDYTVQDNANDQQDVRSTIYWNPNVITNRKGRAKFGFYNSDRARTLQICVEGISEDGVPIFDIYEIGRNTNR